MSREAIFRSPHNVESIYEDGIKTKRDGILEGFIRNTGKAAMRDMTRRSF